MYPSFPRNILIASVMVLCSACTIFNKPTPTYQRPMQTQAPQTLRSLRIANQQTQSQNYVVQSGDTLFSIAKRNGTTVNEVARLNGLAPPYLIHVGRVLRLPVKTDSNYSYAPQTITPAPPITTSAPPTSSKAPLATTSQPMRRLYRGFNQPVVVQTNQPAPTRSSAIKKCSPSVQWQWPAKGRIVSTVSQGKPGIDIFGRAGQPIKAAAAGTVTFSGNTNEYPNLILVQHNNATVSAYALNRKRLVKKGERVKMGQTIAEMGTDTNQQPALHFETRCQNQAVDPLNFLPK